MSDFRPDPKPPKKEKRPRIPLKRAYISRKPKAATGELVVFRMIVVDRGSKSQISDTPIHRPTVSNMIHILAKGDNKYPKFKLYKKNIIIGTAEEHHQYDHGSHVLLRQLPQWEWVFKLRDELLEEYKRKHG